MAGHKTRGIRREEDRGADEFAELAEAAHGRASDELLAARGAVEQCFVYVGAIDAGSDGVHADVVLGPLDGEGFGKRDDSGFAGGVGSDFIESATGGDRSDVDDA